ncbi:hypothetical protein LTR95_010335 [Oleoguttula sp. CCFEE 5521]
MSFNEATTGSPKVAQDDTAYASFIKAYTNLHTLYNDGGDKLQTFVRGALKLLRDPNIPYYRKAFLLLARTIPEVGADWTELIEAEMFSNVVLLDNPLSKSAGTVSSIDEVWQAVQELKEIVDTVLAPKHGEAKPGVLMGREASATEEAVDHDEMIVLVKSDAVLAHWLDSTASKQATHTELEPWNVDSIASQPDHIASFQSREPATPSAARLEIMPKAEEAGYHDEPGKPSAKLKDLFAKSVELGYGGDQPYKNPMLKRVKAPMTTDSRNGWLGISAMSGLDCSGGHFSILRRNAGLTVSKGGVPGLTYW